MREIALTQGKVAIVDDADFAMLSQWRWFAVKGKRTFYAARTVNASKTTRPHRVAMHRLLMGLGPHVGRDVVVDHVNGDGLDNRRANLRYCTNQENASNTPARRGSSKFKGVSFHRVTGKWQAYIGASGHTNLGLFATEEEAARAHDEAARRLHGAFARVNFPKPGEQSCDSNI